MQTILKDNILNEKSNGTPGKEKVDKIMNMIVESSRAPSQTGDKFKVDKQGEQQKPDISASMQHLFTNEILIEGENKEELEELKNKITEELKPSSGIESIIVDRIISGVWRLRRCLRIERHLMNHNNASVQEYEHGLFIVKKRKPDELIQLKALQIAGDKIITEGLSKYEAMIEKQIYKAISELSKIRQRALKLKKMALRMNR